MNNKLPKYWVVKKEQNHPRWNEVIKYINKKYDECWKGDRWKYYGYNDDTGNSGTCASDVVPKHNNPKVLSIDEFFKLLENTETDNYQIF